MRKDGKYNIQLLDIWVRERKRLHNAAGEAENRDMMQRKKRLVVGSSFDL